MIQFMKGGGPYGEHVAAEKLSPLLTIIPTGRPGWVRRPNPDPEDVRLAQEAFAKARAALFSGNYDLVILDEINGAVSFGLVTVEEVLDLIRTRPLLVELVLTGRDAHEEIIAAADLVTEMKEIKHYFKAGIPSREGIEK
jgi:cob(I)alamin adenosyltransferase